MNNGNQTGEKKMKKQGSKYDREMTLNEIAKAVREDIKAAKKAGDLPRDIKVSVRGERSSMHWALNVEVKACDSVQILNTEWVKFWMENGNRPTPRVCEVDRHTDKAKSILMTLEAITEVYNFDNSDPITDYYHVNFHCVPIFGCDCEDADRGKTIETLEAKAS
jgi:hypothetical protein